QRRPLDARALGVDEHRPAAFMPHVDAGDGGEAIADEEAEVGLALAAFGEDEDDGGLRARRSTVQRGGERLEIARDRVRLLLAGAADDVEAWRAEANPQLVFC